MTSLKIQKATFILLFLAVSVIVTYVGLIKGLPLIMVAWAFFPILVYFTNKPDVLFCYTIALYSSQLIVPGMPGGLNIYYVLAFVYIVIAFLGLVIQHKLLYDLGLCEKLVILFFMNLLIVMGVRGAGFRLFGDENWGGMRYVTLYISLSLFLLVRYVHLNESQWHRTFKWYLGLSLMPFLGELLFVGTGGAIYFHYYFLSFTDLTLGTFIGSFLGESLIRFSSASSASQAVIFIALCYIRFKGGRKYISALLFLIAFVLASLSGHRLVIIRMGMFLWLFGLSYNRRHIAKYILLSALAGITVIGFLYIAAPHLPQNAQRMVSFLPGIDIDIEAQIDAHSTTTWRVQVWLEAIKMIPESFWLGQGYTFPQGITEELMLGARGDYVYFWALETMAFHNGILSLLIGMGISGLLFGIWLLIGLCYRNLLRQRKQWNGTRLKNIHNLFLINSIVSLVIFLTLYGDVYVSFPGLFFNFMVMEGIWYSNRKLSAAAESSVT